MNERMSASTSHEVVDKEAQEYESLKAQSELSAAAILDEIECPSDPEGFEGMDQETLATIERELEKRIEDLTYDEETREVLNENRLIVKYLSGYLHLAKTAGVSKVETSLLLEKMERVRS